MKTQTHRPDPPKTKDDEDAVFAEIEKDLDEIAQELAELTEGAALSPEDCANRLYVVYARLRSVDTKRDTVPTGLRAGARWHTARRRIKKCFRTTGDFASWLWYQHSGAVDLVPALHAMPKARPKDR